MIPTLPKSVSKIESLVFYSDLLSKLEDQSTIHLNWHTHKQNPAVCWLCDIPICARKIAYIVEELITKSPLDIETGLSSDEESELEIDDVSDEESLNYDEEPPEGVPEYDVIEESNEPDEVVQ